MQDSKPLSVPVTLGTKLSSSQCPSSPLEMEEMSQVPYQSVVGSLMYNMVCTRPNISQVVGVLSYYMSNLERKYWDVVKRVFRYLWGTSEYSICFNGTKNEHSLDIQGYVDSYWANDVDRRRSTSAYVITLFGDAISWMRKWQDVVAFSTIEVEYMVDTHAYKETIWIKRLSSDIEFK